MCNKELIKQVEDRLLVSNIDKLKDVLPKGYSPERFARIAVSELVNNDILQKCSISSFLSTVMTSCRLGLELGNLMGQCYAVPYKTTCTLQIGYKGMINLIHRSVGISYFKASVVYKDDMFDYSFGSDKFLKHKPSFNKHTNEDIICAYCYFETATGAKFFEVMPVNEIIDIRNNSQMYKTAISKGFRTPWITHFDQMAMKTAIRRLFKQVPISNELAQAITLDEQADEGIQDTRNIIDLDFSEYDEIASKEIDNKEVVPEQSSKENIENLKSMLKETK